MAFDLPDLPVTNTVISVTWGVATRDSLGALDQHTHDGVTAGDGDDIAHASLTGVSSDEHHAQLHATSHEPGGGDAMEVDASAGTGSLRTIGTGSLQSAAGDHGHATGEAGSPTYEDAQTFDVDANGSDLSTSYGFTKTIARTPATAGNSVVVAAVALVFSSLNNGTQVGTVTMRILTGGVQRATITSEQLGDTNDNSNMLTLAWVDENLAASSRDFEQEVKRDQGPTNQFFIQRSKNVTDETQQIMLAEVETTGV